MAASSISAAKFVRLLLSPIEIPSFHFPPVCQMQAFDLMPFLPLLWYIFSTPKDDARGRGLF